MPVALVSQSACWIWIVPLFEARSDPVKPARKLFAARTSVPFSTRIAVSPVARLPAGADELIVNVLPLRTKRAIALLIVQLFVNVPLVVTSSVPGVLSPVVKFRSPAALRFATVSVTVVPPATAVCAAALLVRHADSVNAAAGAQREPVSERMKAFRGAVAGIGCSLGTRSATN